MELRDELLDSLILDNTYIKLEDLDKKDKLEKIIPIVKDMKIVGECRYHVVDVYKHSLYSLKELEEDMRDVDFFRSHLKDEIKLYLEAKVDNKFNRYHILKLGADGTGATSGILNAPSPAGRIQEWADAVIKLQNEQREGKQYGII